MSFSQLQHADDPPCGDGGEQVLELGVRTDPNLSRVEGLGLVALEDGHAQWSLNFIGLAHVMAAEPEP